MSHSHSHSNLPACFNIKDARKTLDDIEEVVAYHTTGNVKITTKSEVPENAIKAKLTDLGFEVEED